MQQRFDDLQSLESIVPITEVTLPPMTQMLSHVHRSLERGKQGSLERGKQHRLDILKMFDMLREHQVHVEEVQVEETEPGPFHIRFPEGSTSQELYPHTTDTRYRVMLPDGLELRLIDRNGSYSLAIAIN